MVFRVLIYGATGYSGKLIADAAARYWRDSGDASGTHVVLASRNESELRRVCAKVHLDGIVLALDRAAVVVDALRGFHVVINAAGPFALTADRLARSALEARCHYVDINGETDVYRRLDDLGYIAHQRGVALVCGAGAVAAASDCLVDLAMQTLSERQPVCELGAIRIAVPRIEAYSAGSARTALRWTREQVPVARARRTAIGKAPSDPKAAAADAAATPPQARIQYLPVGQLERTFDFGGSTERCIASAVALIDVLTTMRTVKRYKFIAGTIEAYMAMPAYARAGYNWGAIAAPWLNTPPALRWSEMVISQWSEGPTHDERHRLRHTVLLEVQDRFYETIVDWKLETPNSYDFTARSVVAVADRLLHPEDEPYRGWLTPAQLLGVKADSFDAGTKSYLFADCALTRRETTNG